MLFSDRERSLTLAVIGNGFDLVHGYKTLYGDFAYAVSDSAIDRFRELCGGEPTIKNWYDFENNIRILTERFMREAFSETIPYEENRALVEEMRLVIDRIRVLMAEYLARATEIPAAKLDSIAGVLGPETTAINFNYTATAEAYTKKIIYIHGSLSEGDIILGYDYRDEPCLAEYNDIRWSKELERTRLELQRRLGKRGAARQGEELAASLEEYQAAKNSGVGLSVDTARSVIKHFRRIDSFVRSRERNGGIPRLPYGKFQRLAVIGHGIEADRALLEKIAAACVNAREVVIFRYDGEGDDEFFRKADFFRAHGVEVTEAAY